ncbi:fumarate reductase subunit FrdC [Salinivibrio socompensis]|uniref:fumarate reductase subunit FrdC n=1 Tax=Salinivibrio socompensis TaxID=1510206 RepID=UPI00047285CE|nr:fumarate reductase subunit FrdC [Salinivibrio socompensis]
MSNRKPYVRPMPRTWWLHHPFYRFYMIREATVLPLVFFTLSLTAGLICLVQGPQAWQGWLDYMAHPVVVLLNLVALIASLFHATTFFSMMPQVMPIRIKGKLLESKWVIGAQWGAVAVVSLIALVLI